MAEYIERGAIIKRLEVTPILKYGIPTYVRDGVIDLVEKQPTSDVVEVKHGRWELVTIKYYPGQTVRVGYCQKCNEERPVDNFCPNCGAKMDLEDGLGRW